MHPAMALWIWSMTMARVGQAIILGQEYQSDINATPIVTSEVPITSCADLHYADLADQHLPDILLDRLAALYWAEGDGDLGV
jgi:hypothetical protein